MKESTIISYLTCLVLQKMNFTYYKKMKYLLQKVKCLFQKVIGSDRKLFICTASITFKIGNCGPTSKGQLISKGLFDVIVSTKKTTKKRLDKKNSSLYH